MRLEGKRVVVQGSHPDVRLHGACGKILEIRGQEVHVDFDRALFNNSRIESLWINQRYLLLEKYDPDEE